MFQHLEESHKKKSIIVEQGGSRSGKTYNILIWLIVHSFVDWENEVIDIFRKSFPSLRTSVMYDFFKILKDYNLYSEENHNKTEHTYSIGSNLVRFGSVDQEQKVRGSGRSYLFLNEANELNEDDFKQLNQRTSKLTILDYNPSDEFHWIYDKVIPKEGTAFYQTTYLDNFFLPERIKKEIEAYQGIDENYWRIYGLGERGISEATIFKNWNITKKKFEDFEGQTFFGMDFGFNDPTTLIRTKYHKKEVFFDELLYKAGLTSDTIVLELDKLREKGILSYEDVIYADNSRPEIIEEIANAGYNIFSVKKGKGSILRGINFMKLHKIYISEESTNLLKEFKSYKWKVNKEGQILDEPVDLNDHAIDGARYSLSEKYNNQEFGVGGISWT